MTWDRDFDDLVPHAVQYERCLDEIDGERTYAPAVSVMGRVEQVTRKVMDTLGKEVVSLAHVLLKPTAVDGTPITPTVRDRFILPADFALTTKDPISVERYDDQDGPHHFVINL